MTTPSATGLDRLKQIAASDPDAAAALARLLARPRPGPSPSRRAELQERDNAIRALWRLWPGASARAAAGLLSASASRYLSARFGRDRDAGRIPEVEPQRTICMIMIRNGRFPGEEAVRKIMASTG